MLTLEQCNKILNRNKKENKYTEKQVEQIRAFIYQLVKIDLENFQLLNCKKNESDNNLRESFNR